MPILPTVRPLPYHSTRTTGSEAVLARALRDEFVPKLARRLPGHHLNGLPHGKLATALLTAAVLFCLTACGGRGGSRSVSDVAGHGTDSTLAGADGMPTSEGLTLTVDEQAQVADGQAGAGQLGSGTGQPGAANSPTAAQRLSHGERLQLPTLPATLTDPTQRTEYLLTHYWDNYDFADTTLISNADYTEQAFVDFIYLLPNVPPNTTHKAINKLIGKAATNPAMFYHFTELAESYLYDPNSPMRSEELYIPVLESVIALPGLDDVNKIRPRHQLTMARKNRPGMRAADFMYITERPVSAKPALANATHSANGNGITGGTASRRTGRLSALKGDYTLLFFYDPDCPDCKRVKQYIAASNVFGELTGGNAEKRLTVLALYTDADLDAWRSHLSDMPPAWIVAYDKGTVLRDKEVYDLRAIPTLYLLDKEKRVLLKDAAVEQVEMWLAEHE